LSYLLGFNNWSCSYSPFKGFSLIRKAFFAAKCHSECHSELAEVRAELAQRSHTQSVVNHHYKISISKIL